MVARRPRSEALRGHGACADASAGAGSARPPCRPPGLAARPGWTMAMPPTTRAGSPIRTHGRRTSTVWSAISGAGWAAHVESGLQQADGDAGELSCSAGDCTTTRRRDGRHPARTFRGSGSGLHGSTRTRVRSFPNTPDTYTVGQRLGHAVRGWPAGEATRCSWRRPRAPSVRTLDGACSGGQLLDETEVADHLAAKRGRAIRPGMLGDPAGQAAAAACGRPACRAASTRGTSRSTWNALDASGDWAIRDARARWADARGGCLPAVLRDRDEWRTGDRVRVDRGSWRREGAT
jgi:hypothetical protein